MRHEWQIKEFESCITPVAYTRKIQRKEFLDAGRFPIVSQEAAFTNGFWNDEADVFRVETPIVVFGDHTQVLKFIDFDFVLGADGVKILQPREFFHPKFFFYQLQAVEMPALGYARHYRLLKDLQLVVPPLDEQRRIVGVLDEAFVGLAKVRAHAERNLKNARALFESHLESVFTQRGERWIEKPLEEACAFFVDSAHRTPKHQDEGIPALRPRDVVNGKLNLEGALRVSEAEYEVQSKRYTPRAGDIVYSRELSYGWAALLPDSPRVCLSQGMCIFRPADGLDAAYLLYVLNGPVGRAQAVRAAVGAAHPHINLGDIKSFAVPVPPIDKQREIVAKLDALSRETEHSERLYQQKLAALAGLKTSLLRHAFSRAI